MNNVFIIHGAYGNPHENWFDWLKEKLEELGCKVFVPKFPTPENQTLENWLKMFGSYREYVDENTIFVAHSLGPSFVLNLLEQGMKIKASFFASGFTGVLNDSDLDPINKTFAEKEFDWEEIKKNCGNFLLFHADNDPFVPLSKGKNLAKNLDCGLIVIENGGHLNEEAGYNEFGLMLDRVKEILD